MSEIQTTLLEEPVGQYSIAVYDAQNALILDAIATRSGVSAVLSTMTTLNGELREKFMHELYSCDSAHVKDENNLPYEVLATRVR